MASKFGLNGLSKAAALEYADAGTKAQARRDGQHDLPGLDANGPHLEPQIVERAKHHGGDRTKGIADMLSEKAAKRAHI